MKLFINAIFGGIMIAISSYIYLQVGGIVGAFLFSIGLYSILAMNFKLYTGAIGFCKIETNDIKKILIILLGNFIGTCFLLIFPQESAKELVINKLSNPLYIVFIKSIICGIFMYNAVSCFNKNKWYMVGLSVAGFILFGGEHCIADLSYFIMSDSFDYKMISFVLITILGNSVGAILIDRTKII